LWRVRLSIVVTRTKQFVFFLLLPYAYRCQNVVSIERVTIEAQQSVLCIVAVHM